MKRSERTALPGMTGFAEAPSLAIDNNTLYYHAWDNGIYAIYGASR